MIHPANRSNRDTICCGQRVPDSYMSDDDRKWAQASSVIQQDSDGAWYHTQIGKRERAMVASAWKPDTGRERSQF